MKRSMLLFVLCLSAFTLFSHNTVACGNGNESNSIKSSAIEQNTEYKFLRNVGLYIYNANAQKFVFMQNEKLYQDARGNLYVTYLSGMERVMNTNYTVKPYFQYCFFGVMGTMYYFN